MLAGTTRRETGSKGGGGLVRLLDVDTWELAFILVITSCIQEFLGFSLPSSSRWKPLHKFYYHEITTQSSQRLIKMVLIAQIIKYPNIQHICLK